MFEIEEEIRNILLDTDTLQCIQYIILGQQYYQAYIAHLIFLDISQDTHDYSVITNAISDEELWPVRKGQAWVLLSFGR